MSKKTIVFLVGFAFLFSFNLVEASVIINEIMYAPENGSNYEWIEIFNSGSESVDLQSWRFFHGETSGPLTLRNGATTILQPSKYAIIAKSPSVVTNYDWLNFSGMILSASTISLPDSGDNTYIAISYPDQQIVDSIKYDTSLGGSKESKTSLSNIDGIWQSATPTPGVENQVSEDNGEEEQTEDTVTGSSGSSKKTETKEPETPLVNKTKITAQIPAFVGLPVQFKASNTVSDKSCGKYFLNFGDGNFLETEKTFPIPEKFSHIYHYPGEYIVTLECYESYLSAEPDSSDKIIVKVISSEVVISKIGDAKDFFIEISNNAPFEANISGWVLISYQNKFVFPKNTIIKSKNKIIVSPKTTNFSILDKETLKLIDSEGKTVFDYSSAKPIRILARNPTQAKVSASEPTRNAFSIADAGGNNTNINVPVSTGVSLGGPVDNLLAGAIKSDVNTGNNIKYGIFGLFALLGVGTSTAYFIRNRNRKSVSEAIGNDFETMDE